MKRLFARIAFIALFSLSLCDAGLSETWYVDGNNTTGPWLGTKLYPFRNIQDGIDAASNGDEVLVMPYVYLENINFKGKAIRVRGKEGPDFTTIDGGQSGTVVVFKSNEGLDSVLEGFTIANGSGTPEGSFGTSGGAIVTFYASPTILGNIIKGNSVTHNAGGIFCSTGSPRIENNIILENSATHNGGGIYCVNSSPTIHKNTLYLNPVGESGGAIYCYETEATITENTIYQNSGTWSGGIACYYYSASTITSNVIYENSVNNYGGAIYCYLSDATIKNNALYKNTSNYGAGGIFCLECSPKILNTTIRENSASSRGGGVYCDTGSPIIKDCILWNNSAPDGAQIFVYSASPKVTYCDVQGGWSGKGNIDKDPRFVEGPLGPHYLGNTSPCIDAGSAYSFSFYLDSLTTLDILTTNKNHLPDSGVVDMGFHYISPIGARFGNVNLGGLSRAVVLRVNGSEGDNKRVYSTSVGAVLNITMDTPPAGPNPAHFALYIIQKEAGLSDMRVQPHSLGTAVMPMPLSNRKIYPPPLVLVNNIGYWFSLGYPLLTNVQPAPCTILDLPYGLQQGAYTLQGVIYDYGSVGLGGSLTNAIVLSIQ